MLTPMHPAFRSLLTLPLFLPLSACGSLAPAPATEPLLAITHVDVIPVHRPGILEDRTVLIRGDRIVSVSPSAGTDVPDSATLIDGQGRFLVPGLADMHEHLPRGGETWESSVADYFDHQLAAGVNDLQPYQHRQPGPRMGAQILEAGAFDPAAA